jgi:microcystin-dependent protein
MDYYLGELRVFSFGLIPRGWLACNGQLLAISQNQALFALLGTTYGGNGVSTFQLPNLQGTSMLGYGTGNGGTYVAGEASGTESVTLTTQQLPMHNHIVEVVDSLNTFNIGAGNNYLSQIGIQTATTPHTAFAAKGYNTTLGAPTILYPNTIAPNGGNAAHENRMPFLTLNVCIATAGIFPSRN